MGSFMKKLMVLVAIKKGFINDFPQFNAQQNNTIKFLLEKKDSFIFIFYVMYFKVEIMEQRLNRF